MLTFHLLSSLEFKTDLTNNSIQLNHSKRSVYQSSFELTQFGLNPELINNLNIRNCSIDGFMKLIMTRGGDDEIGQT